MTARSESVTLTAEKPAAENGYLTYVEGVGDIPRDIYRYVQSNPFGDLPRYSIHIRMQHLMVFTSFLVLAATGLPLYFSDLFWAPHLIAFFGGIELARRIHRIAAIITVLASIYHIATVVAGTLFKIVKGRFSIKRTQIPLPRDLYDLIHDIKYFLGLEPYRPKMGKFTYKQKFHYLAILWGNTVMITAGSFLLFPDLLSRFFPEALPGFFPRSMAEFFSGSGPLPALFQDFARLMHVDEAIMAVIVLTFWHLTNVHLVPGRFPMQWTFLTGKITREHQIEEHFLEYLNNLREIPAEREYMRDLLREKGFSAEEEVTFIGGKT